MVTMRTEKSKAELVNFCRYINRIRPTSIMAMVEIGSFAGDSTAIFCKWFKHVIAIDPWVSNIGDVTNRINMDDVYSLFQENLKSFPNLHVIRDYSYNVCSSFKDGQCDLVYIDGGHTYKEVRRDIADWLPKVKRGGFITGHDYWNKFPGVVKAVNELIGKPDKIFVDSSWIKRI